MNQTLLGLLVGGGLGLIDGLSAWFTPEARPQIVSIVLASTVKGLLTGAAAGEVARRWRSMTLAVTVGIVVGFVLSVLAAMGHPDHYWEIVLPGMLVGLLAGVIAQRHRSTVSSRSTAVPLLLLVASLSGWPSVAQPRAAEQLATLGPLIGHWHDVADGPLGNGELAAPGKPLEVHWRNGFTRSR
jgi:hypothetical protein